MIIGDDTLTGSQISAHSGGGGSVGVEKLPTSKYNGSILELLRCQKKAVKKAPIHRIGDFRETGLALVIVLRCD